MTEQYFASDPSTPSNPAPCSFPYRGHGLNFLTDAGVFSRGELTPEETAALYRDAQLKEAP